MELEKAMNEKSPEESILKDDNDIRIDKFLSVIFNEFCPDFVKSRTWHLRLYRRCFVGHDLVSWTMDRLGVPTREDAFASCEKLFEMKFMTHVCEDHVFKDEYLFYRWAWDESTTVLNKIQHTDPGDHSPRTVATLSDISQPSLKTVPSRPSSATSSSGTSRSIIDLVTRLHKLLLDLKSKYYNVELGGVDYISLVEDLEFIHFRFQTAALSRIDLKSLCDDYNGRLAFFINVYNLLVNHAFAQVGIPTRTARHVFFSKISYDIGGVLLSLSQIENGILRGNRRPPSAFTRTLRVEPPNVPNSVTCDDSRSAISKFVDLISGDINNAINSLRSSSTNDRIEETDISGEQPQTSKGEQNPSRLKNEEVTAVGDSSAHTSSDHLPSLIFWDADCRIHFALNCGANSCPPVKIYTPENIENELERSAIAFCSDSTNVEIQKSPNVVNLSKIFKWYEGDFVDDGTKTTPICQVIQNWLRGDERIKMEDLLSESKSIKVDYNTYNWSSDAADSKVYEW